MSERPLRWRFEAVGDEKVARAMSDLDRRLKGLERSTSRARGQQTQATRASTKAVAATNLLSKESKNLGREMGMTANTVSEMVYSLGLAIPSMRNVGTQAAMAGGSMVTMGASFGVVGVAVGGLMGALPMLIGMFSDTGEEAANLTTDIGNAVLELEGFIEQVQNLDRIVSRRQRMAQGLLTAEESRGVAEQRRQVANRRLQAFGRAMQGAGIDQTDPMFRRALGAAARGEDVRETLSRTTDVETLRNLDRLAHAGGQASSAYRDLADAQREAAQAQAELNESMVEEEEIRLLGDGATTSRRRSRRGGRASSRRRGPLHAPLGEDDRRAILEGEATDYLQFATAEPTEGLKRMAEQAADTKQEVGKVVDEMARLSDVSQEAIGLSIAAVGAGLDALTSDDPLAALDEWLESFAKQNALKALEQAALGFGNWFNPVGAAAHFESAALHGAAAAAAGGAALAIDSSGGGGGGSGSNNRGGRVEGAPDRSGGDAGPQTIVINYNSPVPEALVGREQRRAQRAYERRFGR